MSNKIHPAERFARQHSSIIFITLAALGMSVVIWLCYQTYSTATHPAESTATATTTPTSFDKATEAKLETLHTRNDSNYSISIPTDQRINPFVE